MRGWIGVDLDGTLAEHHGQHRPTEIGKPVPAMVARVKRWLEDGKDVRIFTARIATRLEHDKAAELAAIRRWCQEHLGRMLPVTNAKDLTMVEFWDDRAVEVRRNLGEPVNLRRRNE